MSYILSFAVSIMTWYVIRLFSDVMQMKREGKQKASSLSVASERAVEWSNSEVGDEPSAMETAPFVHGGAAAALRLRR